MISDGQWDSVFGLGFGRLQGGFSADVVDTFQSISDDRVWIVAFGKKIAHFVGFIKTQLIHPLIKDPTIQGTRVGQKDDTTVLVNDLDSVLQLLKLLDHFKRISGLEINASEIEAMGLCPWRNRKDEPFGFDFQMTA